MDRAPGKSGKVIKFDIVLEKVGQGKVRESGKVRENVLCLWCITTIAVVTE